MPLPIMTHKTCTARQSCNIFIWWLYLAWLWPLLSVRSILIYYLLRSLGCVLAKFGLTAVISPVPVADKAKSDDLIFYLTLTWYVTCSEFFSKSYPTVGENGAHSAMGHFLSAGFSKKLSSLGSLLLCKIYLSLLDMVLYHEKSDLPMTRFVKIRKICFCHGVPNFLKWTKCCFVTVKVS